MGLLHLIPTLVLFVAPSIAASIARETSPSNGSVWPQEIATEVYGPEWPGFANATERWSAYEAPTFNEVFIPQTPQDLSLGLRHLSDTGRQWLALSGGHGYSPTLRVIQDAVLINLRNFTYSRVNGDNTLTVGTGSRFRDIITTAYNADRELTVGNCPCVGALGAMLGGGLGRLQGLHGLTSDALREIKMVLWDGTLVTASDKVNQELFWGMRGAGQNFGIVYEATFETFAQNSGGNHYVADFLVSPENLTAAMDVTNSLLETDPALAIATIFQNDPRTDTTGILINIVYAGPAEQGRAIASLYEPLALSMPTDTVVPWPQVASTALLGGFDLDQNCTLSGGKIDQYSVLVRDLPPAVYSEMFESFTTFVRENPLASTSAVLIESFGEGAINALPADYSAFPHRHFFANAVAIAASWTDDAVEEAADAWAVEWRNRLARPEVSGYDELHVYQNYANDDEPLSALYGFDDARHKRLTALKKKYDPRGHFDGYHAIPRNLANWS
ncbi:hypothetical protein S40293_07182 [Stachybotrys chartarum IBT 40293]|nr:hypothetical protein S40293_07182 [Stachybotrys chartarum IBT 40293]KFA80142.1 hypothetical protein S40288_04646 [Stachybotrys chartarum IBT 40288]